jgi:hypothetical protein
MRRVLYLAVLSLAMLLAVLPLAKAQSIQSSILGNVRDSAGAVVPRAQVTLLNEGTSDERTQSTDESGDYRFSGLLAGTYRVSVQAAGFKAHVTKGIVLDMSQIKRVDAQLQVGDVATSITVEGGNVAHIETEAATLSVIKTAQDFADLPFSIYGRGWLNITNVTAGVQSTSGFEVNGARDTANNFTSDGVSVNDIISSRNTANGFSGDIENFKEIKVMTANNSAEFAQVAQFAAVSKSGENTVHGSVYWSNYNSYTGARSWQDPTGPAMENMNQFLVNNGGPVYIPHLYNGKNRTFYFFSYGGARYRTGSRSLTNIPPLAFREGDFSALLPSITLIDPTNGQPFSENKIPESRISSVSNAVQKLIYANPNLPGQGSLGLIGNYYADPGGKYDSDVYSARIDQKVTDRNDLFVRVGLTINNKDSWPGALLSGYGGWRGNHPGRSVVVSDTHIFSPTVVNEAKLGFSRDFGYWFDPNYGPDVVGQIGLQGISNPSKNPTLWGMPDFSFNGANWFQGTGTWANGNFQAQNTYQVTDNLSWFRGRHNLKFGFNLLRYQINDQVSPQNVRGGFSFDDQLSGFNYANFLLGYPSYASLAIARPNAYLRSTQQGYYIQDEFKINPRITLTYGLRYEYQTPWADRFNRLFSFDPASGSLVTAGTSIPTDLVPEVAATLPIISAQQAGMPTTTLLDSDKGNWSPRIGVAYRPFGDDKTVVRLGYGLFTSMWPGLLGLNATGGPWQSSKSWYIVNNEPSIQFPNPFQGSAQGYAGVQSISALDPHLPHERSQQWNISVGRQIWKTAIDVGYVGTKAKNLPYSEDLNQLRPSTTPFDPANMPYQRFSSVGYTQSGASSIYHGLTIKAERRAARGLTLNVNYTWAKALTDVNLRDYVPWTEQNQWNRQLERGDDPNVRRQILTFDYIYELPIGKGRPLLGSASGVLNHLVSGWQVAGITTMVTGPLMSAYVSGVDPSNTNNWWGRPDRVGDGNLSGSMRDRIETHQPIFDVSAFEVPASGRGSFGNSARMILTAPGSVNWNVVAAKNLYFAEGRARAQLRCELFNAFNHPNFRTPDTNMVSPGFGLVTGANSGRRIQVAARIDF